MDKKIILLSLAILIIVITIIIIIIRKKSSNGSTFSHQYTIVGYTGLPSPGLPVSKNNILTFELNELSNTVSTLVPGLKIQSVVPTNGTVSSGKFTCDITTLADTTFHLVFNRISTTPIIKYTVVMTSTGSSNSITVTFQQVTITDMQYIYQSLTTSANPPKSIK